MVEVHVEPGSMFFPEAFEVDSRARVFGRHVPIAEMDATTVSEMQRSLERQRARFVREADAVQAALDARVSSIGNLSLGLDVAA